MSTASCPTEPVLTIRTARPTRLERSATRMSLAVMLWVRRRRARRTIPHEVQHRMLQNERSLAVRQAAAQRLYDRPLG